MKIIVSPDSFKGSCSAIEVADSIEKAIHEFGYVYSACMLFNKLERFRNLIAKNDYEGKVGESLVDTLLDMANYAVETARVMMNDMEYIAEMQRIDEVKALTVEEFNKLHPETAWGDWGEEI